MKTIWFSLLFLSMHATSAAQDPGWPRELVTGGHRLVAYQPQLTGWEHLRVLRAEMALAVTLRGEELPAYGVMELSARTTTDLVTRLVHVETLEIDGMTFRDVSGERLGRLQTIVLASFPRKSWDIALDRVLAGLEGVPVETPSVEVGLDPPQILWSRVPAILVQFLGEPRFEAVGETGLSVAVNTNWDVFRDAESGNVYVLHGDGWLMAEDLLAAEWRVASELPAGFAALPKEGFEEVARRVPGTPGSSAPSVFVTYAPAELIVTAGEPRAAAIPGVDLAFVENTESDLFVHGESFYLLVAGRWFRAPGLAGPWSAATRDLPAAFALIPEDHPKASILASVPGTPDAQAAVIAASIPRVGTVQRDATITVDYDGEPRFEPIAGTAVAECVNTAYEVFLVTGRYYCCYQGVWFEAAEPSGPWRVCTSVPEELYAIPPTSSKHHVTYVHVYEHDDDEVEVGCSAGYWGTYVGYGVALFGAAWLISEADAVYISSGYYRYPPYYYSYGCAARYSYYDGTFVRSSHSYGPYGGAGWARAYDPSSGAWAQGTYRTGAGRSARAWEAYNPETDSYAARVTGRSPYGSAGRSVAGNDDGWVRAGHRSTRGGGAVGAVETSDGDRAVVRRGPGGFTRAATSDGDVYAGRNGEVYRRGNDGNWKKYEGGEWKSVEAGSARGAGAGQGRTGGREGAGAGRRNAPGDRPSTARSDSGGGVLGRLRRNFGSRERGNRRTEGFRSRSGSRGGARGGGRR